MKLRSRTIVYVDGFFRDGIRSGPLAAAQFPHSLNDASGTFHKPPSW